MTPTPHSLSERVSKLPVAATIFFLMTAAIALLWSHHKLLDQDEIFVLQTDSVASVAQLVHIQHAYPISLDPLVYHLLAHAAVQCFGANAFALRLPSLLGYLLMQACLFLYVRRLFGDDILGCRAGTLALAFPAITATLFYAAEARPYGLLLGLYALTLLSWHIATQTHRRTAALITLALAVALTLNSHYFGVLLLIPLCAAEVFRTMRLRRIDRPVVAAIVTGMAAIIFTLPFQKAAGEFRKHYYNAGAVSLRAISQSFRALFVDYTRTSLTTQRIAAAAFVVLALALVVACFTRWRTLPIPPADAVFVITLAALPLFGFLLARFVTHTIEVRYVLGSIIGITILLALVLAPLFRADTAWRLSVALLFVAIAATGCVRIHNETRDTRGTVALLLPSAQLKAAMLLAPDHHLYMQDMGRFEVASYYEPDPWVRAHMALVYSPENEIRFDHHDTASLTAEHMQHFTDWPIVAYDDLKRQPGAHIFVLYKSGWNWTGDTLAADHASIRALGPALDGTATVVNFAWFK